MPDYAVATRISAGESTESVLRNSLANAEVRRLLGQPWLFRMTPLTRAIMGAMIWEFLLETGES